MFMNMNIGSKNITNDNEVRIGIMGFVFAYLDVHPDIGEYE